MDNISEIIMASTGLSSILALVVPFLLPLLWKLFLKTIKREASDDEKRYIIIAIATLVSGVSAFIVWRGQGSGQIKEFFQMLVVGFASFRGIVQFIYETIIRYSESRSH